MHKFPYYLSWNVCVILQSKVPFRQSNAEMQQEIQNYNRKSVQATCMKIANIVKLGVAKKGTYSILLF